MNLKLYSLLTLVFILGFTSCKKDDDGGYTAPPLRDRAEQQVIDRDSLLGYLETHYYNASLFDSPGHSISELEITDQAQDENGNENVLLSSAVTTYNTTYKDVDYEYYILNIYQGGGKSPHFPDVVRVRYAGSLLDASVFDSTVNPAAIELVGNNVNNGAIEGWKNVLPKFNASSSFSINNDGTVDYTDYGMGVMFLPSGLGYYGSGVIGIPVYSNLIFKFELYQVQEADHDGDGIPTYVEDLNENEDLLDDDTDSDIGPNFIDNDDDNDGVLTLNELQPNTYTVNTNIGEQEPVLQAGEYERSRTKIEGFITIKTVLVMDSDSNGIADYLEDTITINYNE